MLAICVKICEIKCIYLICNNMKDWRFVTKKPWIENIFENMTAKRKSFVKFAQKFDRCAISIYFCMRFLSDNNERSFFAVQFQNNP